MSRPTTASSMRTTTTESGCEGSPAQTSPPRVGHGLKEKVIFTGPDGLAPHRRKNLHSDFAYAAECETRTPERSNGLAYLTRGPSNAPFPLAKNGRVGEIGWEAVNFQYQMSRR